MRTACAWSEKLPFAGYSVVKDHSGLRPEPRLGRSRGPAPLRFLAARSRSPRRIALWRYEAVICQRAPLIERLPQARV